MVLSDAQQAAAAAASEAILAPDEQPALVELGENWLAVNRSSVG